MKRVIRLKETELKHLISESIKRILFEGSDDLKQYVPKNAKKYLSESVSLYGKTILTYEDIPQIMNGELPYRQGYNNQKWYVLPLPNGKYCTYLCSEENKEEKIKEILKNYQSYETKSRKEMETWVRFNLMSKEEAEEWLMGSEICSLLDNKGYETEMWSQLGSIGGIEATKDGKTFRVVGAEPSKKELMKIIDYIKSH